MFHSKGIFLKELLYNGLFSRMWIGIAFLQGKNRIFQASVNISKPEGLKEKVHLLEFELTETFNKRT